MFITPGSRQGRNRRAFKDDQGSIYPSNVRITASVANSLLYVSVSPNRPGRPMWFPFRHPTATDGSTIWVSSRDPLLINTVATGATLASSNSTAFRFWVCVFYATNGALYPALINCSTSTQTYPLTPWLTKTTTAISGSATAAGTFYSPVAISTASPFCIVGYVEYNSTGLATAGTYATAPNFIQTFGPGVHLPGDQVQIVMSQGTFGSNTTTASATFVATAQQATITPTSAVNLIIAEASGPAASGASARYLITAFSRGTSNNTNIFGGSRGAIGLDTGGQLQFASGLFGIDQPNTTSSQTYAVQILSNAGSGNVTWSPNAYVSPIRLTEIMG